MKKVFLRYPNGKLTKDKKFKLACTTNGSVFRSYIGRDLTQFRDEAYFLLNQTTEGAQTFLDESIPFSDLTPAKKIRLQLILRNYSAKIKCVNGTHLRVMIDLKEPVSETLKKIVPDEPEQFVLCFKPRFDPSFHRISTSSMPLIFQGWFATPLVLLRRVTLLDMESLTDPEKIMEYYAHCKTSASLGLSLFSLYNWGTLACLRYIAEGGDPQNYQKQSYLQFIPEIFRANEDVISAARKAFITYASYDAINAAMEYINVTVHGAAFCYIDKVKFLPNRKKWSAHRYIYISSSVILITKDFGSTLLNHELLSKITNVSNEQEFVVVSFANKDRWRVRSEKAKILYSIIEELRKTEIAKNQNVFDLDEQESIDDQSMDRISLNDSFDVLQMPSIFDSRAMVHEPNSMKVEVQPGISMLICPKPEEGDCPYNIDNQLYRDLKIIEPLQLPDDMPEDDDLEAVPDLSWLNEIENFISLDQQMPRIILCCIFLVALLILFIRHSRSSGV